MTALNSYRALSRYNRWMNENLYSHAAKLSDEQRKHDTGAFFKSIHRTLNHILLADRVWIGRLTGAHFVAKSLGDELYSHFEMLRIERAKTDEVIIDWIDNLSDSDLTATLAYKRITGDQTASMPLKLVLTHFFNHQTHHRGQAHTIVSICTGVEPPSLDMLQMQRGVPAPDLRALAAR
jgi:uncharacterized damage-inducible protein DinB